MNKAKRFHFVSFSFEIFSAKLISINYFFLMKKKNHELTINRALAMVPYKTH